MFWLASDLYVPTLKVRVEDSLNEMSRNTTSYLDQLVNEVSATSRTYLQRLDSSEQKLETNLTRLSSNILNEFNYSKLYVEDRLKAIESKLDSLIQQSFRYTNSNLDSMSSSMLDQLRTVHKRLGELDERTTRSLASLSAQVRADTAELVRTHVVGVLGADLRAIQQEMVALKRALGAESAAAATSSPTSGRKFY